MCLSSYTVHHIHSYQVIDHHVLNILELFVMEEQNRFSGCVAVDNMNLYSIVTRYFNIFLK